MTGQMGELGGVCARVSRGEGAVIRSHQGLGLGWIRVVGCGVVCVCACGEDASRGRCGDERVVVGKKVKRKARAMRPRERGPGGRERGG